MSFTALQFARYQHKARIRAMADGVRALGGTVVDIADGMAAADIVALVKRTLPRFAFTCGMHHVDAANRGLLAGLGVPLLVLDCGYFRRAEGSADETGYNQLGLGQLNWVPTAMCPSDRWQEHGIGLAKPVQGRARLALVLGQVPGDSQHHLSEQRLGAWLTEQAAALYAQGYLIQYRPHPKHVLTKIFVPHQFVRGDQEPLAQALSRASVAVAYNSTSGLEALIAGVPMICHATAHYAGLTPGSPELAQHCHRLSYTQWTCAELRAGAALRAMQTFAKILPEGIA